MYNPLSMLLAISFARLRSFILLLLLLVGTVVFIRVGKNPVPEGPDILLITIDGLRVEDLEGLPAHEGSTPWKIGLRKRLGRSFDCVGESPSTLASHATLWSGLPQEIHGVRGPKHRLSARIPRLPERLHSAGYRTAAVISSPWLDRTFGLDHGFESYENLVPFPEGTVSGVVPAKPPPGVQAEEVTRRALSWLTKLPARSRFFLHVHYGLRPWVRGGQIDQELGRLLDGLESRHRLDGTFLVLLGTNGSSGPGSGTEVEWRDRVGVPLMIRFSGNKSDWDRSIPVGTLDVTPTILAAAGLRSVLPGRNLASSGNRDRVVLAEGEGVGRLVRQGRLCLRRSGPDAGWVLYQLDEQAETWVVGTVDSDIHRQRLEALEQEQRHELAIYREEHYPGLDPHHPTLRDPRQFLRGIGYLR